MTPDQLQILQHSLGVDKFGQGRICRNHFCAGDRDEGVCRELVALGYMRTWNNSDADGRTDGFPYYNCSVTDAGKSAMLAESPQPPKLTRSQKQYRAFLKADTGYSFIEWLNMQPRSRNA